MSLGTIPGTRPRVCKACGDTYVIRYARMCAKCQPPRVVHKKRPAVDLVRIARMETMFRQGLTLQQIGDQFGLSRERIRQILDRAGVEAAIGGAAFKATVRRDKEERQRELKSLNKWGYPCDEMAELRAAGVLRAYKNHRHSAASRAIAFDLSFSEWLSIWKASGKLHLRGRGLGKYCMSRINDAGGYTLGNVHVQSCVENSREAMKIWVGRTKTNRGVFLLYPGLSRPWAARYGKTSLGFFATEQEAVAARNLHLQSVGKRTNGARGWTIDGKGKNPYQVVWKGKYRGRFPDQETAEAVVAALRLETVE